MKFEEFKNIANATDDISKFRKYYFSFVQLSGTIPVTVCGFHISHHTKKKSKEILSLFNPLMCYSGNEENKAFIESVGYSSSIYSWFQEGGFAVVLIVPYNQK